MKREKCQQNGKLFSHQTIYVFREWRWMILLCLLIESTFDLNRIDVVRAMEIFPIDVTKKLSSSTTKTQYNDVTSHEKCGHLFYFHGVHHSIAFQLTSIDNSQWFIHRVPLQTLINWADYGWLIPNWKAWFFFFTAAHFLASNRAHTCKCTRPPAILQKASISSSLTYITPNPSFFLRLRKRSRC